jgi:tetratricopeptide (TPR) repeat protein
MRLADKPIMSETSANTQNLLANGAAHAEQGRLKEAALAFRQATKAEPNCDEAYFNLGAVLAEMGKSAEAVAAWRRVLDLLPDIADAHRSLGATLLEYETPRFDAATAFKDPAALNAAIAAYRRAIDAIPILRECHRNMGDVQMNAGQLADADKAYAQATRLPADLEDVFADVGATLIHPGDLAAAAAIHRQAMALAPDYDPDDISEKSYLETDLTISDTEILLPDGFEVMMEWERPIMERSAQIITVNGGDVLNVGFGLGIIDTAIQQFDLDTHTIIEAHPQVVKKAEAWAEDKKGVRIVPTRWQDAVGQDALDKIGPFDGIFFDTLMPPMIPFMAETPTLLKDGGVFTFFQMMIQFDNIEAMVKTGLSFALERMPFEEVAENRYYRLMEKDDQGRFTAPLLVYRK